MAFTLTPMSYALTLGTASFLLAVFWGRPLINLLKRHGIGKQIRVEEPDVHQVKTGTPTMGGALILIAIGVTTLLWGDLGNRYVWVVLLVMVLLLNTAAILLRNRFERNRQW